VPNRRRRKLSTAMSAVAALAVASPFAVTAVSDVTASSKPAPEQHDFVQAAMATDLPGEIMSALQSSLSQFGVVVPNLPSGIMGPAGTPTTPALSPGGLTAPAATPGLTAPTGLTAPGLTAPTAAGLTDPSLANPALTPGTAPGLPPTTPTNPTTPGLTTPPTGLTPAGLTTPGLTTPGLTTPTGLTAPAGVNPALTSPLATATGLGAPGEVPIGAPVGGDPLAGSYPLLGGDPSSLGLGGLSSAAPSSGGSGGGGGGLMSSLSNAVNQLGAGQAIDLLKGVVVPSIMQAIKGVAPAAPGALPAPAPLPLPTP
jgi:hypothetical protein